MRIGSFRPNSRCKKSKIASKTSQDELAIGLALVITLLIIGGVEPNPGPDHGSDAQAPGPSFVDATAMDVMEALRLTQLQLDKLTKDMTLLTSSVQEILRATKQATNTNEQENFHDNIQHKKAKDNQNSTAKYSYDASTDENTRQNKIETSVDDRPKQNTASCKIPNDKFKKPATIVVGGTNVSRLRDATKDQTDSKQNDMFVRTNSSNIWDLLPTAIKKARQSKLNVVLHTGADLVLKHAPNLVLECLSKQIELAKQFHKTRRVLVCSVEERVDAGYVVFDTARTVNSELQQLCEAYGATFIDLRPTLAACKFEGINRTGLFYTFEASKNIAETIVNTTEHFLG